MRRLRWRDEPIPPNSPKRTQNPAIPDAFPSKHLHQVAGGTAARSWTRMSLLPHTALDWGMLEAATDVDTSLAEEGMSRIDGYRFGRVVVDGTELTGDVIVLPNRVIPNWWRIDGHALVLDDLDGVLGELPDRLIVGTGADGRMRPDPGLIERLEERGVHVEVHRTDEAIRRYADLDPRRTAAALHLTC